jgi:RHS repeat-associated protein
MAVYKTSGTTNLSLEEQHIYGSSRLGIFKKNKTIRNKARVLGERRYELTDHLGNVRVVLSDYKKAESIVISATDYYPFGMVARTYTSPEEYRYGFNGKELDRDEEGMGGGGSTYDYGFRIYNPALARFLSVDPLTKSYPWYTPYQFAGNKPISHIDLDGLEEANVKTQTFSIKPELQPGDETTIDGQKYKVVSMTMINVSYFYSDHEGAWDQAGKDKGIPVSAEKLPAGYRQQGLYDIPVAYIIDYLAQGFSDPRIHGVTGDGFSGVARVKIYQNTAWRVVYELIPPPPPQPVPVVISPIVPQNNNPIKVNPVNPVITPNNDKEIVINQQLAIDFDDTSTDYDTPGFHFGDDPIDNVIDPIVKILNENPQNYIELRVTTRYKKNQKINNSKYPTAEALLKARADKIKQDFIKKGVDPTKIKIIIDDQSYNVPQAVHGKLHQFKKQAK